MSEEKLEIEISPCGILRTAYSDDLQELAAEMGAKFIDVERASCVEWRQFEDRAGWTVQSYRDPSLFICEDDRDEKYFVGTLFRSNIAVFTLREKALEMEKKFFWDLLPPRRQLDERAIRGLP